MRTRWARRGLASIAVAATAFVGVAAWSWACIAVASLNVAPGQVQPGQEVEVSGRGYNSKPVTLRFNALDGPVLATITPEGGLIRTTVTIPSSVRPGNYLIMATQDADTASTTWGIPSRALITVGTTTPAVAAPLSQADVRQATDFERQSTPSSGSLLLVGLGVAGAGLLLVGVASVLVSRPGRRAGQPAAVKS